MNDKISWLYYEAIWHIRKMYEDRKQDNPVKVAKQYAGKNPIDVLQTNRIIFDAIKANKPFFAGRIGGNEMNIIAYTFRNRMFPFRTDARKENVHDLCIGAGFFPDEISYGEKFVKLMCDSAKSLNIDGAWSRYMEEWFLNTYATNSEVTWLHNLEPWNVEKKSNDDVRWTYALKGKRVLVIHPFADTIQKQYGEHRKDIFANIDKELLPEFDLITLKAVQSMGGGAERFEDWFQAYEYMLNQCKETEFDVAVIGCGAYGFPLGAAIKEMGKVAIHLGGVTQLLFGIRGKRWDTYGGVYESMINDSWTRPADTEITSAMRKVEGGCYI